MIFHWAIPQVPQTPRRPCCFPLLTSFSSVEKLKKMIIKSPFCEHKTAVDHRLPSISAARSKAFALAFRYTAGTVKKKFSLKRSWHSWYGRATASARPSVQILLVATIFFHCAFFALFVVLVASVSRGAYDLLGSYFIIIIIFT